MSQFRKRRTKGFARTRNYPLKNHPAFYKKLNDNYIEYVTFTHSEIVDFPEGKVKTEKLNVNINYKDPKEKGRNSYVVPRVYEGRRSDLNDELHDFRVNTSDRDLISGIFNNSKRYKVNYTSNSKKKRK